MRSLRPLVLGIALGACAAAPDLNVQDHGVLWPTLRLHWRGDAQLQTGPGGNTFVTEATYGHGVFAHGGSDYDLFALQTRVQVGTDASRPLSVRLLGGLEYVYLGIDDPLFGGSRSKESALGPLLGLGASLRCWPDAWLYARGTAAGLLPDTTSSRAEAGLSIWPGAGVEIALGYRWWRVRREDYLESLSLGGTDIDLHTDGIVVAFGVVF